MLKPGLQRVLGTRTRDSLDGVEAAMLVTDGRHVTDFGASALRRFSQSERETLRAGCAAGASRSAADAASVLIELAHAELAATFDGVDLMGFQGLERGPCVDEAAAGQVLAQALGWPVMADFSTADRRLGGQGGPMTAFYHHAAARLLGFQAPVAFLDLDAFATLTWCDPCLSAPELACLAFDCGPGSAALDEDRTEAKGTPDPARLDAFAALEYFRRVPPKLCDPALLPDLAGLTSNDARATLAAAIATGVALAFEHLPQPPTRLLVTGAGRRNATLMAMIAAGCDVPVEAIDTRGLDGDTMGAQATAFLAARVAQGLPTSAPGTTGVAAPVGGGTLCRP